MNSSNTKQFIISSRPIFWLTHYTAFLFGGITASSFNLISIQTLVALFLFGFPFSFVVYTVNDIFDTDTDNRNARKGGVWGPKALNPRSRSRIPLIISMFLMFLLGIVAFSFEAFLVATFMMIMLILYSVPPIRLKQIPIIDHLAGGALYAYLIAVTAVLMLGDKLNEINFFAPLLITLFGGGWVLHSLGAVLDEKPDSESGEITSVTYFGSTVVIIYTAILLASLIVIFWSPETVLLLGVNLLLVICFLDTRVRRSIFIRDHFAKIYLSIAFVAGLILTLLDQLGIYPF